MNKEHDHKLMNIVGGELIEAKDHFENLINFTKRWQERMHKIEEGNLSREQALVIANHFINEAVYKFEDEQKLNEKELFEQINHDLFLVLSTSINRYEKENPSFWNRFAEKFKMPDFKVNIGRGN